VTPPTHDLCQPRERAVSCIFCAAPTWNTFAVCDRHPSPVQATTGGAAGDHGKNVRRPTAAGTTPVVVFDDDYLHHLI
jgi:hypothetical protein